MRLFSLIAALDGAEVITRDGRKVGKLQTCDTKHGLKVIGEVDGCASIILWMDDGRRFPEKDDPLDLFMASNDVHEDDSSEPINEYNFDYRIPELMMDLSCQLRRFPHVKISDSLWELLLEHSPIDRPLQPFQRLTEEEMIECMAETITGDDLVYARAIEDALARKNGG